ncbi:MAG: adenine phosphoribosyltransferase [Cyanobacteria bacterium]|nr:adenine phosphoribosyltransferase [Cyanobacteriota bacterium]
MDLKEKIRNIPDFPKKGIIFFDITTLVKDGDALRFAVDEMAKKFEGKKIDAIMGAESRGFIFGAAMAYKLGVGFIPVRKPGKLPYTTCQVSYDLEYGSSSLEMHVDAIKKGDNILIVDDLVATGGTAKAMTQIIEKMGGNVVGLSFLVELSFLNPRKLLEGYELHSLVVYDSETMK